MLVAREKPGFQALSKGLLVLLRAEVVRQGVPDPDHASTSALNIPPTSCVTIGDRTAFGVAGPLVWNSLPSDVSTWPSLTCFKQRLKTLLF